MNMVYSVLLGPNQESGGDLNDHHCDHIAHEYQVCLSDVEKIFQINYHTGCAKKDIDEPYAFFQCFEITICLIVLTLLV